MDWMPGSREGQAAMAADWIREIPARGANWNVPQNDVSELTALLTAAKTELAKVQSAKQTQSDTADCTTAFFALKAKMRSIKERNFYKPPLNDGDYAALGLKPPDQKHSTVPPPTGFAEADISYPGVGALELYCRAVKGQPVLDKRSGYGFRIYYGIYPHGGATVEQATGKERLLMKIPESGDLLPHSKWARKRKETLYFSGYSSMTVYFCIRYENSKGEAGPWGPLFSAVIP